jgi:hypothetical protein
LTAKTLSAALSKSKTKDGEINMVMEESSTPDFSNVTF